MRQAKHIFIKVDPVSLYNDSVKALSSYGHSETTEKKKIKNFIEHLKIKYKKELEDVLGAS